MIKIDDRKHFNAEVDSSLITKMYNLISEIDMGDVFTQSEFYDNDHTIQAIEGNYYDGYIPHQDGGYMINSLVRCDMESYYHETENQTNKMNELYDDMLDSFMADYNLSEIDYDDPEVMNLLCDYDNEWFDPALVSVELFTDYEADFNSQCVIIRSSINYMDAPYYREKYAEDIKLICYTINEFMGKSNEDIISELIGE